MSFLQSRTRSARQGIGKPVPRTEDARLLVGQGRYSDDVSLPGQAYACLVRSPHAHARIRRIDGIPALAVPGVVAVLTGEDAAGDGLGPIPHRPVPANPHEVPLRSRDGAPFFIAPHCPLPVDRARFVGEAVALVIAETPAAARDGAERVRVDWEPLPAVTGTVEAAAAGAPRGWEETTSNVCVDSHAGDAAAADAAFARAAHVVRLETWVQRVTGVPMEPRAAVAVYDEASGRHTLYAGSGGSVRIKSDLAATLGVPESAVRVVAREGGEAPAPAREVDVRATRGVPHRLPRPRPRVARGARARRRRPVPRPPGRQHEQRRRPRRVVHPARQGHRGPAERLPHPRRVAARPRRAQPHVTHVSVSQRGPARGDVRHRAAD